MITHNPEAASYGDRIIHMRDGEIVAPEKDPQWAGHSWLPRSRAWSSRPWRRSNEPRSGARI